ncbi:hypothetical protein ACFL2Q_05015 [Thermodesulfobacteriota bacterium]
MSDPNVIEVSVEKLEKPLCLIGRTSKTVSWRNIDGGLAGEYLQMTVPGAVEAHVSISGIVLSFGPRPEEPLPGTIGGLMCYAEYMSLTNGRLKLDVKMVLKSVGVDVPWSGDVCVDVLFFG